VGFLFTVICRGFLCGFFVVGFFGFSMHLY
jgi:hypothetical protein